MPESVLPGKIDLLSMRLIVVHPPNASRRLLVGTAAFVLAAALGSALPSRSFAGSSSVDARQPAAAIVDVTATLGSGGNTASGSGIVLTGSGLVLTNNHVIAGATRVRARDVGNGRTYAARVLGYDVGADVAVLRLEHATGLAVAPIGGRVRVGESVRALGNADGVGGRPSSAAGKVTAVGRSITAGGGDGSTEQLTGMIETNTSLEPGDSGGPLVDAAGKVVGIDTAASLGFRQQQKEDVHGYAVPIGRALDLATQIEAGRRSRTMHIGPTASLGVAVASAFDYGSVYGARVVGVVPGSPAASAGIRAGGTIFAIGGKRISSLADLSATILRHAPNDRVVVSWSDQDGKANRATVRLASGPPQ